MKAPRLRPHSVFTRRPKVREKRSFLRSFGETAGKTLGVVVALAGVVGAYYLLDQRTDEKIQKALESDSVIRKIAAQVRPAVIFDQKGSILADLGGMQHLESISVPVPINARFDPNVGPTTQTVIVTPKYHLAHEPLLESVDDATWIFSWSRGKGHEWVCSIVSDSAQPGQTDFRFRLEIIR